MATARDPWQRRSSGRPGYGLVCDEEGRPIGDLVVADANQEHGIVGRRDGEPSTCPRYPVGTRLRILPNHALRHGGAA